jgi:hypothetical protein
LLPFIACQVAVLATLATETALPDSSDKISGQGDKLALWRSRASASRQGDAECLNEQCTQEEESSDWKLAPEGNKWGAPAGEGEGDLEIRVLVCMPTMRRKNGVSFVERTLAAVRGQAANQSSDDGARLQVHVLMLVDHESRPPGADYYLGRKPHNISAPCGFMRWRRALVLDFMHMMQAALEILDSEPHAGDGNSSDSDKRDARERDYVLWLEDDALLEQDWKKTLYAKLSRGGDGAW